MSNPAFNEFLQQVTGPFTWGQVLITRQGDVFELRHHQDKSRPANELSLLQPGELRGWAMHTVAGEFRPLKSAPSLRPGWRCVCKSSELYHALNQLYPGSIPDWFTAQQSNPPITPFREFVSRQSGMYRITNFLGDEQAAEIAIATCHPRFCIKRRLWNVLGLLADDPAAKSAIPCLEPCAILLETARKAVRIEQEPKIEWALAASELETLGDALEALLEGKPLSGRTGDLGSSLNPRRLQLLLEKCRKKLNAASTANTEENE